MDIMDPQKNNNDDFQQKQSSGSMPVLKIAMSSLLSPCFIIIICVVISNPRPSARYQILSYWTRLAFGTLLTSFVFFPK
jgi:hypothetical protein